MLLVLLQNAWSVYYRRIGRPSEPHSNRLRVWGRECWLDATWSCKTGRNLTKILDGVPDEFVWVDNTTLEIADRASGVKPVDIHHLQIITLEKPIKWVLACGKQAGEAIDRVWSGPVIKIPHPAFRSLTNEDFKKFNAMVLGMISEGGKNTDGHTRIREGFHGQAAGQPQRAAGTHPHLLPTSLAHAAQGDRGQGRDRV